MKLICTQENFKKAISNVGRVAGKQIILPILENILLEAEQGTLKISATNLEIGITLKLRAKIEEEGKITIPARVISDFAANLPGYDTISLKMTDSILEAVSGEYRARIKGLGAQEFPIIPEPEGEFLFAVPAGELKDSISRLLTCVAVDSSRPELSGVNISFFEGEIHLAATDSFRLTEAIIPIEKTENYKIFTPKTPSIIVPAQTLAEVLRVADDDSQKIMVTVEENQIFFQLGSIRIVSRLINGKYPEYKHIIPREFATQAMIPKEELAGAVKIASIFAGNKSGEVTFSINSKDKKIAIEAQSAEAGENETQLSAEISGPNQKVVFNPRYILDGINSVTTPSLALLVNGGSTPAVIRMMSEKDKKPIENCTYVVMPIKSEK